MRKISGFIISLFLLVPVFCKGQDTIRYPIHAMEGIRIGFDISKPLLPFMYDNERFGIEASADMHIKGNFFGIAEAGFLRIDLDRDTAYHYKSNGVYAKAGIDFNLTKSRIPYNNDSFYAGVRYGFSVFGHEADNVTIPGYYWPDAENQSIPQNTMSAHWVELLLGIRAEVLKNFYIGLTFRGKFKIVSPKGKNSTPYIIPGYGKGSSGFELGLNYYLYYNIHF